MATCGAFSLPQRSSIRRGARSRRCALADCGDHWIALDKGIADGDFDLRADTLWRAILRAASSAAGPRSAAGVSTRSRTPAVASASRISLFDTRCFPGQKDAGSSIGFRRRFVVVEPVLPEQPAKRSRTRLAFRQPIPPLRQRLGQPCQAPRGKLADIRDCRNDFPLITLSAGKNEELKALLAVEARRIEQARAAKGFAAWPRLRSCPCRPGGRHARVRRDRAEAGKQNRSSPALS